MSWRAGAAVRQITLGDGGGIASVVYGTVIVMATITAAYASERDPAKLAVIVMCTCTVLWVAHLHAHGIAESIALRRRLTLTDIRHIALREMGILGAAVLPCCVLTLGGAGLLDEPRSVWLALGIGLATLAAQGVRYARLERLGPFASARVVGLNLALGLVVVALKVAVLH